MESCILEQPVGYVDRDLYDLRYFYQKETWKYSCGMARQALMSVYRRHQFSKIPPLVRHRMAPAFTLHPSTAKCLIAK